jgi:hypothetical protein
MHDAASDMENLLQLSMSRPTILKHNEVRKAVIIPESSVVSHWDMK